MSKNTYWIRDPEGVHAQVEGADQRDAWTRVHGWRESGEPGQADQVHVVHPEAGRGRIPYGALAGGWSGLGWSAGSPPDPVDVTKDPQLVDQPEPAAEPVKPKTPAASGAAEKKE